MSAARNGDGDEILVSPEDEARINKSGVNDLTSLIDPRNDIAVKYFPDPSDLKTPLEVFLRGVARVVGHPVLKTGFGHVVTKKGVKYTLNLEIVDTLLAGKVGRWRCPYYPCEEVGERGSDLRVHMYCCSLSEQSQRSFFFEQDAVEEIMSLGSQKARALGFDGSNPLASFMVESIGRHLGPIKAAYSSPGSFDDALDYFPNATRITVPRGLDGYSVRLYFFLRLTDQANVLKLRPSK